MLFGETIDLFEGLQITLLGMLVVFLALMLLMAILVIMERVFYKTKNTPQPKVLEKDPLTDGSVSKADDAPGKDIIAVITAACASSLGVQPSELVIRNIKRVSHTTPAWNMAGRSEQINNML